MFLCLYQILYHDQFHKQTWLTFFLVPWALDQRTHYAKKEVLHHEPKWVLHHFLLHSFHFLYLPRVTTKGSLNQATQLIKQASENQFHQQRRGDYPEPQIHGIFWLGSLMVLL